MELIERLGFLFIAMAVLNLYFNEWVAKKTKASEDEEPKLLEVESKCDEGIHFYQHIYDEEIIRPNYRDIREATKNMNMVLYRSYVEQMTSKKKTYVQSVCRDCGHVIKKENDGDSQIHCM